MEQIIQVFRQRNTTVCQVMVDNVAMQWDLYEQHFKACTLA